MCVTFDLVFYADIWYLHDISCLSKEKWIYHFFLGEIMHHPRFLNGNFLSFLLCQAPN